MKSSLICPVCGRGTGDSRPPCPACPDGPQSRQAPELPGAAPGEEQPRVVNAEVLGPENASNEHTQGNNRHGAAFGNKAEDPEAHSVFGSRSIRFRPIWSTGRAEQNACLAPCVSFALFLVCLAQFGVLAGIGFVFFHILGSVVGSLREMREIMQGRKPNPWVWRIGNWFVSFLLVAWLSGGFD